MGVTTRKPILPAPTESLIDSAAEDVGVSEDIATDLSRRTDHTARTSATIPDDGSPVTISTGHKKRTHKIASTNNPSQTSLLIEYYEGNKDPASGRQPSLRVRVRPSAGAKSKEVTGDGHIVVTQRQGSRTASISRHIPLNSQTLEAHERNASLSSLEDLEVTPRATGPIDIEIGGEGSGLSKMSESPVRRYQTLGSDVSSMPADSMLGMRASDIAKAPKTTAMSEISQVETYDNTDLKPPVFPRERNASHERITQKAIEKLSSKDRQSSRSTRRHSDKSQGRSTNIEGPSVFSGDRRRKSSKPYAEDSLVSTNTDMSDISNSLVSANRKPADQQSVRSGASNITNPKLLQTVEDAIRRLILPELKEIKRNGSQRVRPRDEDAYSEISENSIVREKEASRRVSSSGRTKRRVSKDSAGSEARQTSRHHREAEYDSISDISSPRKDSYSSTSDRHYRNGERDHRLRNAAAGLAAGTALTAAALHHQDSSSTLERRRRRKRSKSRSSRSRSASINESEEYFEKHEVPPMPFRSEIGSEITRSSLLSSNTANTATPTQREVREVIRGSPLEPHSSPPHTPSRGNDPSNLRQILGTHHTNYSEQDLSMGRPSYEEQAGSVGSPETRGYSPDAGRKHLTATGFLADPERLKQYERNLHQQHPIRRGLSPIQSVASYTTEPNRNSMMQTRSIDSIASAKRRQQALKEEVSIDSFSSASPDLKKQNRPQGINLENRSDIMRQHDGLDELDELDEEDEDFYDEQHSQNDMYRRSFASSDFKADPRRLTGLTEDSMDKSYTDKLTSGQQVAGVSMANPEYIHTPPGVESAVASLIEPSILETNDSPRESFTEYARNNTSSHSLTRDIAHDRQLSPLKQNVVVTDLDGLHKNHAVVSSPPQSPAQSYIESGKEALNVVGHHQIDATSPQSEITTNPSPIQGPIGGLASTEHDHWPYNASPNRTIATNAAGQVLSRDLAMHAPDLVPEALRVSQRTTLDTKPDAHLGIPPTPTPPQVGDEGYATGDNPRSPDLYNKRNETGYTPVGGLKARQEDPFTSKREQYVSGLSQGMSPLYDPATGKGIDRIQSKDIVALMDHLTVRDAQRNARDTEILITLVRSAAEMRNSFEDMKKFIAEQDGIIMDVAEDQHERTQKAIGGPRPQPVSRAQHRSVATPEDTPQKRRNIFRRALQGLGSKNAAELQNIEHMLMQLLDDVDDLRTIQLGQSGHLAGSADNVQAQSMNSAENMQTNIDPGYEPEGLAGTPSTGGDRSGFFSGDTSRQNDHRNTNGMRQSSNRVSTVIEGDEEEHEDYEDENNVHHPSIGDSPSQSRSRQVNDQSANYNTPPKMHDRLSGPWANDDMPQYAEGPTSAGRKHKSIASTLFGKGFMSRWSKTTASTAQDHQYGGQGRGQPYSQVSRSGSDLGEYDYVAHPDDRLRSRTSLDDDRYRDQENRPPSPLVPSQVSAEPKYQVHRNSQNMQHPQPRQGPTGRYQYHLESEAIAYNDQFSPTSQVSSQWENQHGFAGRDTAATSQYVPQAPLSPISDGGYSEVSGRSVSSGRRGPARHPKILDDEPLVPQRQAKAPMSPANYVDHVSAARAGSPAYDRSPINSLRSPDGSTRKPSGPRPLSSTGQNPKPVQGDMNAIKKTRFRGSPYQIVN